ncbi:predicted protein [Methanosarcina acetivorans C2A]|uniref:Uncharacterized protein n=1 Tax=Methanosarcina acetivorans (strain ATCC 35395 / DSM 2834 / JCM 12185 / C2A) TaxID=188937 RepID=Q8TRP0_METAC|nr:predicted protein [Methanosarcina acetivorans C2A]
MITFQALAPSYLPFSICFFVTCLFLTTSLNMLCLPNCDSGARRPFRSLCSLKQTNLRTNNIPFRSAPLRSRGLINFSSAFLRHKRRLMLTYALKLKHIRFKVESFNRNQLTSQICGKTCMRLKRRKSGIKGKNKAKKAR